MPFPEKPRKEWQTGFAGNPSWEITKGTNRTASSSLFTCNNNHYHQGNKVSSCKEVLSSGVYPKAEKQQKEHREEEGSVMSVAAVFKAFPEFLFAQKMVRKLATRVSNISVCVWGRLPTTQNQSFSKFLSLKTKTWHQIKSQREREKFLSKF